MHYLFKIHNFVIFYSDGEQSTSGPEGIAWIPETEVGKERISAAWKVFRYAFKLKA